MPSTQTDPFDFVFELADAADKPQCVCCVIERTGQAGTLKTANCDTTDLDSYAVAASAMVLSDAESRSENVETGELTAPGAATRLRVIAYVASTLGPAVVTDYAGRYTLTLDEDGYLPDLGALEVRVTLAAISLRGYLTDHDNGQWIDPNALAGTVVDVHDAALALETWWTLTAPADDGTVAATADV